MGPAAAAVITLEDVDTGTVVRRRTAKATRSGTFRAVLPPVPEGIYRLTATAVSGPVQPVSDLVTVLGPDPDPARADRNRR
jgi:hypothetical protein